MVRFEIDQKIQKLILKHLSEVVAIIDVEGNVKYESDSVKRLSGYDKDEMIGSNILDRAHPEDRSLILKKLKTCFSNESKESQVEYRFKNKKGKWRIVEAKLINIPGLQCILLVANDITDYRKTIRRAYYYEYNDQITNLPNKEMLINRLDREIFRYNKNEQNKDKIFALMVLGLRNFSYINELYSLETTNKLLKNVGEKLKKVFRSDDLVSKIEGNKFAVLFSDISATQGIDRIIQKVRELFSGPFKTDEKDIIISVSMGISVYPHDGNTPYRLLKNSSLAQKEAEKYRGTSCELYNSKMNKNLINRMKIETELQLALENNHFSVFYQPKVLESGYIIGLEALVRWESPKKGLVPPSEFITVMENNGMISEIDRFVFLESCRQIKKWTNKGLKAVPIAVNISPFDLNKTDIPGFILKTLDGLSIDPRFLEVEITESGIMENTEENIKKLSDINEMGISISIDDFGTGHSSLSKLRDFPVDKIKIDKSFVDNIPSCRESKILVKSIINLAHNLNYSVVAEGVEKIKQVEYLKMLSCDQFQGYYYSRPVTACQVEKMLYKELPQYKSV